MSVNKVILVGNVGKDPETRYLDENTAVCKFSMATSEVYRNREGEKVTQTEWHNVVLWRGLAQVAEKYVKKGSQLYIEGRIKTRSYDDKDGNKRYITEIVGDNMQMLGRKSDNDGGQAPVAASQSDSSQPASSQPASTPAPPQQTPAPNNDKTNTDQGSFPEPGNEPDDLPF